MNKPTISIGTDHGAIELRQAIVSALKEKDYPVIDHGTFTTESVDYPDFAEKVGKDIAEKKAAFGVLICTTGIGMSISANKIRGVRAALVHNEDAATFSRKHNDANIICMGAKYESPQKATELVDIFLNTAFEGGRHERRVNKIKEEETRF